MVAWRAWDCSFGQRASDGTAYLRAEQADLSKLIEYADRLGNGAVFKRLGFLLMRLGEHEEMLDA